VGIPFGLAPAFAILVAHAADPGGSRATVDIEADVAAGRNMIALKCTTAVARTPLFP
jgi:hypothetical protein